VNGPRLTLKIAHSAFIKTRMKNSIRLLSCMTVWLAAMTVLNSGTANADPIPADFDKNAVQFIFNKVSETNFAPLGTCFGIDVITVHKPKQFLAWGKPPITQHSRYFVTAKHVLFDANGNLHQGMYFRADNRSGGVAFMLMNPDLTNGMKILTHSNKSVDIAVLGMSPPGLSAITKGAVQKPALQLRLGSFDSSLIAGKESFKNSISERATICSSSVCSLHSMVPKKTSPSVALGAFPC
jgi:hypothetical protein